MSERRASWRRRLRRRWKRRPGPVPWLLALPQRLFLALLRVLPYAWAGALFRAGGRLAGRLPRRRALGLAHLAQAFPAADPAQRELWLRQACGHLGWMVFESTVLASRVRPEWVDEHVVFEPGARATLEALRGRPAVIVGAHVGSVAGLAVALGRAGLHPAMPIRLPGNYYLGRDLERGYRRWDIEVMGRDGAVRRMLGALAQGRSVLIENDQNAHHQPVFVPWFGRLAATERSPAALSRKTGAALLVGWCLLDGRLRWRVDCAVVSPGGAPAPADDAAVRALTARVHTALEDVIRRHPDQYLWIHDRYRTRPPQEGA